MDFLSLARRDLQILCKKNRIPANMTNVAMADALQALQSVEGLAEIQETLQFESPKKLDLVSPAPPRTSRRTTASRKEAVVPMEQHASPLPRARRVTARASEILNLADEAVEKEVVETPKVPNTRRRATAMKEEKPVGGVTAGLRARQSTKKEVKESVMGVDSMMSTGFRRSTRMRGKASAALKMGSFAKEAEEEKQEKEIESVVGQKNNLSFEETKEEEKFAKKDCDQKLNLESEAIQEVVISADGSEESSEFVGGEEEKDREKGGVDYALTGFEGSPTRGLISSDQDSNPVAAIENLETAAADDGGFELQEPPLSVESPVETEDAGVQSRSLDIPVSTDDQISTVEIAAENTTETTESIEYNGELAEEVEDSASGDEIAIEAVESGDGDGEITAETTESTEDNGDGNGEITEEGEESTGELDGLAVDIPVEVDESGGDLESGALAGEISVEAVEAPDPAEAIAGESMDEMICCSLSGLSLSSKCVGKENSGLTALTVVEAGPTVGGGGGGSKVKPKAEKLNYENLSLRKLKAVYKETVVTIKGKEKRAALRAIDENCI